VNSNVELVPKLSGLDDGSNMAYHVGIFDSVIPSPIRKMAADN
jgi:hypothetical protein